MDATKQAVDSTTKKKKKKTKEIDLTGQSGKAQKTLRGRGAQLKSQMDKYGA